MREEVIIGFERGDAPSLDVGVDLVLACLGTLSPEPCLVRGYGDLGTQLDDAVLALDDLDLRPGFVEVVATANIGGQG